LGDEDRPVRVEVEWPSGATQVVDKVKPNQVIEIKEQ
jgi:hypothetical protein